VIPGFVASIVFLASADGAPSSCEAGTYADYAKEFHENGENYPRDLSRIQELLVKRSARAEWLRQLGAPTRSLAREGLNEISVWVYGAHNKSERCKNGAIEVSYFTQYRLVKVQFVGGKPSNCQVLSRAHFTLMPRPDPMSPSPPTPWDNDVDCAEAEP
jgi:hypothetical protein